MIRACPSCGRKNRVPARNLARAGRCGACRADLPPLDAPLEIADARAFDEVLADAPVPVLVDFWAAWCGPCQAAAPHVAQVARELAGKALVVKVDTERHGALAARYGVRGIPNFVVLRDGKAVQQHAGAVDARTMSAWLHAAGA